MEIPRPLEVEVTNTVTGETRVTTADIMRTTAAKMRQAGQNTKDIDGALRIIKASLTPRQLPDLRTEMRDFWRPEGVYGRMAAHGAFLERDMDNDTYGRSSEANSNFARGEYACLSTAALYWVSEEMTNLISGCRDSIPDDIHGDELPIPSPAGMIYLEVPVLGTETLYEANIEEVDGFTPPEGSRIQLQMVTWMKARLHPTAEHPDGRLALCISSYTYSETYFFNEQGIRCNGWMPLGKSDWPLDDPLSAMPFTMSDQSRTSFIEDRKFLAAVFTLLSQEGVAEATVQKPDRPTVRRAQRASYAAADVLIVKLRRPRSTGKDDPSPTATEWRNRWMVSGHWRWQACGTGRKERKLIFIPPYIKGPEDKELKLKEKVNVWVR